MSRADLKDLAEAALLPLRTRSYAELVTRLLYKAEVVSMGTPDGQTVDVEVEGFWDTGKPGDLRVMASIARGSFRTVTEDFIMAPDGSFVGEP